MANALEQQDAAKKPDERDASIPQQAAFLRYYDLDLLSRAGGKMKREEAAALWSRAAGILLLRPDAKVGTGVKVTLAKDEALQAAQHALTLDPQNANAWRQTAKMLATLKRNPEALSAWKSLTALPEATVSDFTDAGYFAAGIGQEADTKAFFDQAATRFPQDDNVFRMAGWSYLNLADFSAADAAFLKTKDLLTAAGKKPDADLLAGLAITAWQTGRWDEAIATYRTLIETDTKTEWTKAAAIANQGWPDAESKPLEAVRAATLQKHPELTPSPVPSPSIDNAD